MQNINQARGRYDNLTEDDLLSLTPGCYDGTAGGELGLPSNYGALMVMKSSYSYGIMLFADSNNNLYYRAFYYQNETTKGWRGAWKAV